MLALITGASSGIGRDMARVLSDKGYDLILVGRRTKNLEELKSSLKTKVKLIKLDLSILDNVYKLYELTKESNVDLLINNAGFGLFGDTFETSLDRELEMIDVNIKAVHVLTKLFLIDFMNKDNGRILNVASSAGFLPGPRLNTYYATKNYVLKFTLGIYEELRRKKSNVHISCLCPGPVDTEFNKVAGGKFKIASLSSEYVAKYAINKSLKNKLIIIPGLSVKLGIFFSRFIPYKLLLKIIYNIQSKKQKEI